jgi:hypothetical protein
MLAALLGADRVTAEPAAVDRLLARAGGLPRALATAAERLSLRPEWTIAAYVDDLEVLEAGDRGWLARTVLGGFFGRAWDRLDPAAARVLRYAAQHPAPVFCRASIAAMTQLGLPDVQWCLEDLVDRSLLESPEPGWYRFHPLVHGFAATQAALADPADERAAAVHRLGAYLHSGLRTAAGTLHGDPVPDLGPGAPRIGLNCPERALRWVGSPRAAVAAVAGELPAPTAHVLAELLAAAEDDRSAPPGRSVLGAAG